MTRAISLVYDFLVTVARWLSMVALVLLVVLVASAVMVRYFGVLGGSLHWVDEAGRFTMIWLAMLGSVVALDRSAHLAVTLLPDALAPATRRAVLIASNILSAVFIVVLAWTGWQISIRTMGQVSPALGVRMGFIYMAIPVGASVMAFQMLALTVLHRQRANNAADLTF